jgi:hypothetical protein
MIGNGLGTQDQVVSDFLIGATLSHMPQNFYLPRAEIVRIRGTLLRYQRYVGLQCLGKLHCSLGQGLHAKFEQERACLLHQLNCLAVVAPRATGYQQTSVVQVSTSELGSSADARRENQWHDGGTGCDDGMAVPSGARVVW